MQDITNKNPGNFLRIKGYVYDVNNLENIITIQFVHNIGYFIEGRKILPNEIFENKVVFIGYDLDKNLGEDFKKCFV